MKKQTNTLMNFLGAKYSAKGDRVNLTLVKGEGDTREYRNVSIALESENKVQVKVSENKAGKKYAVVFIPFFEEREKEVEDEDEDDYNIPDEKPVKKASKKSNKEIPF